MILVQTLFTLHDKWMVKLLSLMCNHKKQCELNGWINGKQYTNHWKSLKKLSLGELLIDFGHMKSQNDFHLRSF